MDTAYEVLSQLGVDLSFDAFDDLIYEMRHMEYKMIGLFERERLITYAGVSIQTNLYHKRHLYIYDLVTDAEYRVKGYGREMMLYLRDYAKTAMCENIVLSSGLQTEEAHRFYMSEGFEKRSLLFVSKLTHNIS